MEFDPPNKLLSALTRSNENKKKLPNKYIIVYDSHKCEENLSPWPSIAVQGLTHERWFVFTRELRAYNIFYDGRF